MRSDSDPREVFSGEYCEMCRAEGEEGDWSLIDSSGLASEPLLRRQVLYPPELRARASNLACGSDKRGYFTRFCANAACVLKQIL